MANRGTHLVALLVTLVGSVVVVAGDKAVDTKDPAIRDYLSGNGLLNRQLYDLAVVEYRGFLSDHPNHVKAPTARYGLGVSLFRTGKYEATVEQLAPLATRGKFLYAAEVATILGQCHSALGHHAAAAKAFATVVRKHSENELADDAAVGLIEALYLAGQYDEAINFTREFARRWPKSTLRERAEFFGALAEMAGSDYVAAARRFESLLAEHANGQFVDRASLLLAQCYHNDNALDRAARQYRRLLKRAGSQYIPDALLGLGTLLQQQGKAADAGEQLDRLLNEFSDDRLSSQARMQQGRAFFDQGRFDEAFDSFEQVSGKRSEEPDVAAYWMAKCRLRQEKFKEAARGLARAMNKYPSSRLLPEMAYDRAVALLRGDKFDAAVKAFEDFRSRFPEHSMAAEALHLLAATEHQRKRYDESIEHCRAYMGKYEGAALSGDPKGSVLSQVAFLLGENEFLVGRFDKAITAYESFLERYPRDGQVSKAKYRLGTALYRTKQFDGAERVLDELVESDAGGTEVFRSARLALGDIDFQRGEWENAEEHLTSYLSGGLDVRAADEALLKLGLCQQRRGQHGDALKTFDRLIDRFTDSPHRLQALFERGQVLIALDRPADANEAFERVLAEGGESRFASHALNHLGTIAMQAKDFLGAAKRFEQAMPSASDSSTGAAMMFQRAQAYMAARKFDEAEEGFSQFLADHAGHDSASRARAQLAIALARQDEHEAALKLIKRIERDDFAGLDDAARVAVQYEKSWCLRETGKLDEAADAYRDLLRNDGHNDLNAHALLELSGIEFNAERYEPAAELLRRLRDARRSDTENVSDELWERGCYRLAVCDFKTDRFSASAQTFEEFLREFPASELVASASFFCGEALFKTGEHRRAASHLDRVVEKFVSDAVYGPSLLRLGECQALMQHWTKSERAFATFLERFGDGEQWFQARFGVGWARENQRRYDVAIEAYTTVAERHQGPTAARAQFQIGECLFAKKQYEPAVRALLKVDVLYAYPEWSAAALYEAGRCFEHLSKPAEARAQFTRVTENYGKTKWGKMAAQRLAQVSASSIPGR